MPWMTCTQECNTRPSLVSQAMWNTRQKSTASILLNGFASSPGSSLHVPQSLPQHNPQTPPKPNGVTRGKPSGPVSSATNSTQSSTTQSIGPMFTRFILAVIWIYLWSISPSGATKAEAQHFSSPVIGYRRNPQPSQIHVALSRKSCLRRTKAIIQRLWDTAWDLLTHRNVEGAF